MYKSALTKSKRDIRQLKKQQKIDAEISEKVKNALPNSMHSQPEETLNSTVADLISKIQHEYLTGNDFKMAFNSLVAELTRHKDKYNLNVDIPAYKVSATIRKQLRDKEYQQTAWAFKASYLASLENYINLNGTETAEQCYQALMLSFMCDSGLCAHPTLQAFSNWLSKPGVVYAVNQLVFITLQITGRRYNTNVYQGLKAVTQLHCYLSPLTQGLLVKWRKMDTSQIQTSYSQRELYEIITHGMDKTTNKFPTNLNAMLRVAPTVNEEHNKLHIGQTLMEYVVGRTKTYSVPSSNLARITNQHTLPCNNDCFYKIPTEVKQSGNKQHASNDFVLQLKEALTGVKPKSKLSKQRAYKNLKALLDKITFNQSLLVYWLIEKFNTCELSTLLEYHSCLTKLWEHETTALDLLTLNASEYADLYHHIIMQASTFKRQDYIAERLNDMYRFIKKKFSLPCEIHTYTKQVENSHTRAGFIDEALYQGLIRQVHLLKDLNTQDCYALQSLLIFAFRGGVRLNELLTLQLNHLEPSEQGWLEIRNSRKSSAAKRKIPIMMLLTVSEKATVEHYLRTRKNTATSKNSLMFTLGLNDMIPISDTLVSRFVSSTLRKLSNLNYFVFHHLRHTCLSRLQLMIELKNAKQILPNIIPYSPRKQEQIIHTICGSSVRNQYQALACFAGHMTPETTFKHYLHFTDFIIGYKLARTSTPVTAKIAKTFKLASRQQFRQLNNKQSTLNPVDFQPLLLEKLKPISIETVSGKESPSGPVSTTRKTQAKHSLQTCYRALELLQQGKSIQTIAYMLHVPSKLINQWRENALVLKQIKTKNGNPRLFTKARANQLLPAKITSTTELDYLNHIVIKLKKQFIEHKEDITWALHYALMNQNSHQSGIYFRAPSDFTRFVATMHFAIPKSHWRVVTNSIASSHIKDDWLIAYKGIKKVTGKKSSKKGRTGQGTVRLQLIHPSEKQIKEKGNYKHFSSNMIKYLFHMMGIMMLKKNNN